MNNTKLVALASIMAIAAFMIAAATLIPGHDAQARKSVRVGGTRSTSIVAADNSAHQANGPGGSLNAFANAPINTQVQVSNAGSTGTG